MMMMMMMMMMMRNQGFRVQTIFQKREQFEGYHHLIPLQNVPTLDVALDPSSGCFMSFEHLKQNPRKILEKSLRTPPQKIIKCFC